MLLYVMLTGIFPFWRKEDEKMDRHVGSCLEPELAFEPLLARDLSASWLDGSCDTLTIDPCGHGGCHDAVFRGTDPSPALHVYTGYVLVLCSVRSMTRLNRMFPRIVAAQYDVPAHLSKDCCDLISRLMTVDIQSRRVLCCHGRSWAGTAQPCEGGGGGHRSKDGEILIEHVCEQLHQLARNGRETRSSPLGLRCRFSIAEAVQHRWVRENMPEDLKTLNNRLLDMSPQVRRTMLIQVLQAARPY